MSCFVYLIQASPIGRGPVKIGSARDPAKRLRSLQTACFAPLHLLNKEAYEGREQARLMEKLLHRRFRQYQLLGEWFRFEGELASGIECLDHGDNLLDLLTADQAVYQ